MPAKKYIQTAIPLNHAGAACGLLSLIAARCAAAIGL